MPISTVRIRRLIVHEKEGGNRVPALHVISSALLCKVEHINVQRAESQTVYTEEFGGILAKQLDGFNK